MTSPSNTAWARAEAERLSRDRFPNKGWHQERLALVADIESALLAARRRAKEECARIAEGDEAAHADCGHEAEYWDGRTDAAIAIRSTIKESP